VASLIRASVLCTAMPVVAMALVVACGRVGAIGTSADDAERMIHAFAGGDLRALEAERVLELTEYVRWFGAFPAWSILSTFLLGFAAAKSAPSLDLTQRRSLLARAFASTIVVGVLLTAARLRLESALRDPEPPGRAWWIAAAALAQVGDLALAIAYGSGLALAFERWPRAAVPLARIGRNSLTHYIAQSVVMCAIFFGGRWYGAVSPARALAIGVAIFGAQLAAGSRWYAAGPLERASRAFAYAVPDR
jgi:uncharacterized membrane protein YeiB